MPRANSKQFQFQRKIEVRDRPDVLVVGGGPAGLAASITAARQGCRVVLLESQGCLGGMGTAGMLPVFMPFGDGKTFFAGGFGQEIYDRLERDGATTTQRPWGKYLPVICVEPLKRLYDRLVEEAGVHVALLTNVIAVEMDGSRVAQVVCAAKSGIFAYEPRLVIDCTGDGDVAAWSGAAFEMGDDNGDLMPGTLCSLWADINWQEAICQKQEQTLIDELKRNPSILPQLDPHLPGIIPVGGSLGGGNVGHAFGVDGTDERSLTQALILCRKLLPHYQEFYRSKLKGFENLRLAATAATFGVRETRRITGDYKLCQADFDRNASFADEIGRYHYWIDLHCIRPSLEEFEEHKKLRAKASRQGESYGIPYRTLTPVGRDNLLVAGRCVSTDRALQASLRVMPGCFLTGQATGMAAAMVQEGNLSRTRDISTNTLRERLRAMGGYLPEVQPG